MQTKMLTFGVRQNERHRIQAHHVSDTGRDGTQHVTQLQIRDHAVVEVQNEFQFGALMVELRAYQAIIEGQGDNVCDMSKDVHLRLGAEVGLRTGDTESAQTITRRVQREDVKGRIFQPLKEFGESRERYFGIFRRVKERTPMPPEVGRRCLQRREHLPCWGDTVSVAINGKPAADSPFFPKYQGNGKSGEECVQFPGHSS